ncbi:MAG: bifunctional riboflavin kinase/FAD synthetase [Chlorobi bacterium]|nr:bifunctional riboflavin kinase/FAD synthetase [Chlorobiota bacterium]
MFDGLHAGHRVLLNHVIKKAKESKGESVVISFWPHPRIVLNKDARNLRFLTTLEEKTRLFSETGIDHLILIPFTKELASLTAREFIKNILVDGIRLKHLIVGYDHRFGKDRLSDFKEYKKYAAEYKFSISKIEAVEKDGDHISSSVIRKLLTKGDIKNANRLLSYNYLLTGRVKGGMKLGRKLGYPTANIEVQDKHKLIPPEGVYACYVNIIGEKHGGMLNIGYRPTLKNEMQQLSIEVHIFDFYRDIYSEEITVEFIHRIRDEIRFENIKQLTEQLRKDEKVIREMVDAN